MSAASTARWRRRASYACGTCAGFGVGAGFGLGTTLGSAPGLGDGLGAGEGVGSGCALGVFGFGSAGVCAIQGLLTSLKHATCHQPGWRRQNVRALSSRSVTGPRLTRLTSIIARKTPSPTSSPLAAM